MSNTDKAPCWCMSESRCPHPIANKFSSLESELEKVVKKKKKD